MKRQNGVYLFGVLRHWRVREIGHNGHAGRSRRSRSSGLEAALPVVDMVVATDAEAYGGHHPVVAYGRQAVEVMAFAEAWRRAVEVGRVSGPLHVAVEGWLRSMGGRSVVVADGVHFAVPDGVRAEAKVILNRLLQGAPTAETGERVRGLGP